MDQYVSLEKQIDFYKNDRISGIVTFDGPVMKVRDPARQPVPRAPEESAVYHERLRLSAERTATRR